MSGKFNLCETLILDIYLQQLYIHNNANKMVLIGHRFGCPVVLEMGLQLDENDIDLVSYVICVEGSHHCIPTTQGSYLSHQVYKEYADDERENMAIMDFVEFHTEMTDEVISVSLLQTTICSRRLLKIFFFHHIVFKPL